MAVTYIDVAGILVRDHLKDLLGTNLKDEFNDQIEDWKLHIDRLADAAQNATDSFVSTLKAAHAEQEEKARQGFLFALAILEMVAGPALGFLGKAIGERLGSKFLSSTQHVMSIKEVNLVNSLGHEYVGFVRVTATVKTEREWANKILGEAGKGAGGSLVKLGVGVMKPKEDNWQPDTSFVKGSYTWQSFRTKLKEELADKQRFEQTQLQELHHTINNNPKMGVQLLEALRNQNPRLRQITDPYKLAEECNKLIDKWLNEQRAIWAKDWFFYGHNAPRRGQIANLNIMFEREMWAMWVLEEEISIEKIHIKQHYPSDGLGPAQNVEGTVFQIKSKSKLLETKAVQKRLIYLGFPLLGALKYGFDLPDDIQDQDQKLEDASMNLVKQDETSLRRAVEQLNNWARVSRPNLRSLDWGIPRDITQQKIESYTSSKYKQYQGQ